MANIPGVIIVSGNPLWTLPYSFLQQVLLEQFTRFMTMHSVLYPWLWGLGSKCYVTKKLSQKWPLFYQILKKLIFLWDQNSNSNCLHSRQWCKNKYFCPTYVHANVKTSVYSGHIVAIFKLEKQFSECKEISKLFEHNNNWQISESDANHFA